MSLPCKWLRTCWGKQGTGGMVPNAKILMSVKKGLPTATKYASMTLEATTASAKTVLSW